MGRVGHLLAGSLGLALLTAATAPMPGPLNLVAGEGLSGYRDGQFNEARFDGIGSMLWADSTRQLFVADRNNGAIRCVWMNQEQRVSTLARPGVPGRPSRPMQMTWMLDHRSLYFTDAGDHQLKKCVVANGEVTSVCGTSTAGFADGVGRAAQFNRPEGVFYSSDHNFFLVADSGNQAIRAVNAATGEVFTVYRDEALKGICLVAMDPVKKVVMFTLRNRPGIWALRAGTTDWLKVGSADSLSQWVAKLRGGQWVPEPYLALNGEVTAWAFFQSVTVFHLAQAGTVREQSPLQYKDWAQNLDVQQVDYHRWLPELEPDSAMEQVPTRRYHLFDSASALAFDGVRQVLYVGDARDPRILSICISQQYPVSEPGPSGETRVRKVVVFGNSLNYVVTDLARKNARETLTQGSLVKRLEFWLNTFFLADGKRDRFEVVFYQKNASISHSLVSQALENQEGVVEKQSADLVVLNYTYEELVNEAFSFLYKPMVDGELSPHPDPEFLLAPLDEDRLHPNGRRLYRYLSKDPGRMKGFAQIVNGRLDIHQVQMTSMLNEAENRKLIVELAGAQLKRYSEVLRGRGKAQKRTYPWVVNLLPLAANLSTTEVLYFNNSKPGEVADSALAREFGDWCRSHDIQFLDEVENVKILAPMLYPLTTRQDSHYSQRMIEILAVTTAYRLLNYLAP